MIPMYELIFTDTAKKQLDLLTGRIRAQVEKGFDRIAKNPKLGIPLRGELKGIWSERVSTYRILYKISECQVEVLILTIDHRKQVYGGH